MDQGQTKAGDTRLSPNTEGSTALDFSTAFGARPVGCRIPLAPIQEIDWRELQARGTTHSEYRCLVLSERISGPLDLPTLGAVFDVLTSRHESLRTRIVLRDGTPSQEIDPPRKRQLDCIEIASTQELQQQAQQFFERPVDASVGPLFDVRLFRQSDTEYVLMVVFDHLLCDYASCALLRKEIWSTYDLLRADPNARLPYPALQFADFAVWQDSINECWMQRHGPYWRARVYATSPLLFPVSERAPAAFPTRNALRFTWSQALANALRQIAWRERMPLPVVVFALYASAISEWCNRRDMLLGFVAHGRNQPRLADMVGCLASILYVRVEIAEGEGWSDLLRNVKREIAAAYEHQDYGRVPLYFPQCKIDAFFNWVATSRARSVNERKEQLHALRIQPFPLRAFTERVDEHFRIGVNFEETPAALEMSVYYRSDLFPANTIEGFAERMRALAIDLTRAQGATSKHAAGQAPNRS